MLEGVAPLSGFADSLLLFKMLFGALVLFGACVPFLGYFALFLGNFLLFLGCFEEDWPTFLLGLERAWGIFTKEVFLVVLRSNDARDIWAHNSRITKRDSFEIIRLINRQSDYAIGWNYELCFHIYAKLDWTDSAPQWSLIELDTTILHRCEDTTGNLSLYITFKIVVFLWHGICETGM